MAGPPITFTLDVEDHRPGPHAELRFPRVTDEIVEFLAGLSVRGTFFIVGDEARRQPSLVRHLAANGHEVALHGDLHLPVGSREPEELRRGVRDCRALLEDLVQQPVTGFRAPQFSLVRGAEWVTDVLAEEGFAYSSSVLSAPSPLFGYPEAPVGPFRWPSGLIELPNTLLRLGRWSIPLGGLYLRVVPQPLLRRMLVPALAAPGAVPWLYLHPYDFDPGERPYVVRDASPLASPLQWWNRRGVWGRVAALLAGGSGDPLGERIAGLDPQTWSPPGSAAS
jgi:polysaccharide deacetylase family protein (PEP-CTERM system associated)